MGLGELLGLTGEVITEYKADTSDHRAELRKLTGAQKAQAKEHLDSLEAQNRAIDKHVDKVKTIGLAVAGAAAAYAIGKAGFEEFTKTVALQGAAAKIDIDKLSVAAGGLKSQMELLTLAQAGSQGAFKLSTREMETVAQGMRALTKEGFATEAVTQKITKAIQEGAVGQLEEFGIKLQSTGSIAGDKQIVLAALAKEIRAVGGNYDMAGDDVKRAGVKWEDTLHNVKSAIGELVVAMAPLLDALATAVSWIAKAAEKTGHTIAGAATEKTSPWMMAYEGLKPILYAPERGYDAILQASLTDAWLPDVVARGRAGSSDRDEADRQQRLAMLDTLVKRQEMAGKIRSTLGAAYTASPEYLAMLKYGRTFQRGAGGIPGVDWLEGLGLDAARGLGFLPSQQREARKTSTARKEVDSYSLWDRVKTGIDNFSNFADRYEAKGPQFANESGFGDMGDDLAGLRGTGGPGTQARLEQIFGPLEQFDAYTTAWQALTGAVTAGFSAWIDGSASFGKAAGMVLEQAGKAAATQLLIEALKESAYGVAALFLGVSGPTGGTAPQHFAAAAKYGAAALTIGTLAKVAIGGSGGGAGAAGGYHASSGGSSSGGGTRTTNVIIGSGGDDDSPRDRARRVSRAMFLAEQQGFTPRPPGVAFS